MKFTLCPFPMSSVIVFFLIYGVLVCSDVDVDSILESSLYAKEKIISELNMELHNMETTLSNEREQYLNEIKKLNALINEKVEVLFSLLCNGTLVCTL